MFAALLDTCVLYPSRQRDFLLSLAVQNLYRPLWSSAILEELQEHEAEMLVGYGADEIEAHGRARRLIERMREAFDDAEVLNWEPHVGTFELPDPDDEPVLAAALVGHAGAIVTENLKDFPADRIPHGIQVVSAAEFAADTVAIAPAVALTAVREMVRRAKKPPMCVDDYLRLLYDRYGLHEAVELMRDTP